MKVFRERKGLKKKKKKEGNADAKKLLLPLSQQVLKIQFFQFFVLSEFDGEILF